ncbi:MAG TPA: hypothetical protein VF860_14760 [Candidatus Acidoferrales bacterium]
MVHQDKDSIDVTAGTYARGGYRLHAKKSCKRVSLRIQGVRHYRVRLLQSFEHNGRLSQAKALTENAFAEFPIAGAAHEFVGACSFPITDH